MNELQQMNEMLKELCDVDGISGYEFPACEVALKLIKPYADEAYIDPYGSVIAHKRSKNPNAKTILLDAHIDQIGFLVSDITKEGFLRITIVAGLDPRLLLGAEVLIAGIDTTLNGVIATIPTHLKSPSDGALQVPDMLVDIGYTSKEDAEKHVKIGARVAFGDDACNLTPSTITAKSLDDRGGVASIIHTFKLLQNVDVDLNVIALFSAIEERFGPGASIATWVTQPDLAIAIDVTHADTPDADPLITVSLDDITVKKGPNLNKKITNELVRLAKVHDVSMFIQAWETMTTTNARAIEIVRQGTPVALFGLPLKYMHTQIETIKIESVISIGKLTFEFIRNYKED